MATRSRVAGSRARAPRCVLVDPASQAETGRSLLERCTPAFGAAEAEAVAAASSDRHAAREPRRTGAGRGSPARGSKRPVRTHVGHPRSRRLGVDVLDRRRAQPAGRRAGGGSQVRREAAERCPDGPRRLLGLRGAGRAPDDRSQGARRRDRLAHGRSRHRHRRGHVEGDRRHRRGEPGSPPGRRRARDRFRARSRRSPVPTATCRISSCS